MAASSSSSSFVPLLLLFLTVTVESRRQRDNKQVLHTLFGSRLSSFILAPPTSDDITEGSAGRPAPSSSSPSTGLAVSGGAARGLAGGGQEVVPRFFLDLLQRQSKMRRRSRKSMIGGGRGCFGMKMDRIGSISGLGC
ncbi:C-type natriuretic peptide 2-like [Anarrhichthys ocellatus]|uniref:C-type natriuretic peptide 2-like n=1 Tax=Anarrhichthys ocellatus TaxID=433405 RepID=UPI0012ECEDA1|nr:C-type natriuretic peptide 2-like [Anarrhichthys ocellatus]